MGDVTDFYARLGDRTRLFETVFLADVRPTDVVVAIDENTGTAVIHQREAARE